MFTLTIALALFVSSVAARGTGSPDCWPTMPAAGSMYDKMDSRMYKGDVPAAFMVVVDKATVKQGGDVLVTIKSIDTTKHIRGFVVNAMAGTAVVGTLTAMTPTVSGPPAGCAAGSDEMKGTQTHSAPGEVFMQTFKWVAHATDEAVKIQAIALVGPATPKAEQFFYSAHAMVTVDNAATTGAGAATTTAADVAATDTDAGTTGAGAGATTTAAAGGTTDAAGTDDCTSHETCMACAKAGCAYCATGMTREIIGTGKCQSKDIESCGTIADAGGSKIVEDKFCEFEHNKRCETVDVPTKDIAGCNVCVAEPGCAVCSTSANDPTGLLGTFTGASCSYIAGGKDGCVLPTAKKFSTAAECDAPASTLVFSGVLALIAIATQF